MSCTCSSIRSPVARPRLFPDGAAPRSVALTANDSYENGVLYLAYRPQG